MDPDLCHPNGDITYHEDRRGSRILPLRSYANPPAEDKFAELEYFDFRFDNVSCFYKTSIFILISILS